MKKIFAGILFASAFISALPLAAQQLAAVISAPKSHKSEKKEFSSRLKIQGETRRSGPANYPVGANEIQYYGGPIMLGVTNIYYIWYGDWSVDTNALPILQNLAANIGGSPYFNINTGYFDANSNPVSNAVSFNGSTTDSYSQGKNLTDAGVFAIVNKAITSGNLPLDANGVYFVLTSPDVTENSGFISEYCGWHNNGTVNSTDVKYAFVGDAATQGLDACAQQTIASPNNDLGADAMASVVAHELEEAVTDPDQNAWMDPSGNEVADMCAWTFGTTYGVRNGSAANMNIGGMDYLIQQNWVNASGGYCSLSLGPAITGISPNAGLPGSTVSVSISGSNLANPTAITVSGSGVSASVLSSSASQATVALTIASGAAAGARSVSLTTSGGKSNTSTFTVGGSNLLPTLSSVSPASGIQTSSVPVTITGANFTPQTTLAISGSGITASNLTVVSTTQITATLNIAASAVTGSRSLTVSTATGPSNSISFTVSPNPAGPSLSSIAPSSAAQGTTTAVTLNGNNFSSGSTVNISGSGVTLSNVVIAGATQITANVTVAASAATGSYQMSVSNSLGISATLPFTVLKPQVPAPTLTSLSPATGAQGTLVPVILTGTGLTSPAAINISGTGVSVTNASFVGNTQIKATLDIDPAAPAGAYIISVTTPNGTTGNVTFTVTASAGTPVLSSVTPATGVQGTSVSVKLMGSSFTSPASVSISGSGVSVSNVLVVSVSQINATLTIASNATVGQYNLAVTTASGVTASVPFTVSASTVAPTLSSISPASGMQGSSVSVALTGTGFVLPASINISGSGVAVSNVSLVSSTQITATLTIASSAAAGQYNLTVTTAGGATGSVGFTVNAPAPIPTLSAISPATGVQGSTVSVTLTGSNFTSPASLNISGSGVTASNVAVVSATQITATLTIASSATTGAHTVSVTTPLGTTATASFSVTAASTVPTLTAMTPSTASAGTSVNVVLTGTNFTSGTGVRLAGTGASTNNTAVVVSPTQINVTFTFTAATASGAHNVYVTNSSGNSNILPFTIQ